MTWCEHNGDPATCPPCRRAAGIDPSLASRPHSETVGQPFPAAYPGHCTGCNLPIVEGQLIARKWEPGTGYLHVACSGVTADG